MSQYTVDIKIPDLTVRKSLSLNLPSEVKNNIVSKVLAKALLESPHAIESWSETWSDSWGNSSSDSLVLDPVAIAINPIR